MTMTNDDVDQIAKKIFEAQPVNMKLDIGPMRTPDWDSLVRNFPEQVEAYRKEARKIIENSKK